MWEKMILSISNSNLNLEFGFELIISVAITDAEKSEFDVLLFLCIGIDIMILKKIVKGIVFHRLILYKQHY